MKYFGLIKKVVSPKKLIGAAMLLGITIPTTFVEGGVVVPFSLTESSDYLIIARDEVNTNTDAHVSNFEIGANKAPVPSTDNFLDGGSTGGPTLYGAVPSLPSNAKPVFSGVGGHGNIAITDSSGDFDLQNIGVYADPSIGIRTANPNQNANKSSDSFFNDGNMFPNTYDPGTNSGNEVGPGDAVQSTRIDKDGSPGSAGVTYGDPLTALKSELAAATTMIDLMVSTDTLKVNNAGKLSNASGISTAGGASISKTDSQTYTVALASGLNIIDIDSGVDDFSVGGDGMMNFVIDGGADSAVIFRLSDGANMKVNDSNVLIGNSGIDDGSVMFFSHRDNGSSIFDVNNAILNGIAFWAMGDGTGEITINNSQGCVQLVADVVNLNDVRYNRCAFAPIPEPATLMMLSAGALYSVRRRRRNA